MSLRSWRRPKPSDTCRAPRVAMRFSPNGAVHACCANTTDDLGRIGEQTIGEIWNGVATRSMGDALAADDYPLGCGDCAIERSTGNRDQTTAVVFDRFAEQPPPAWPQRMEFALSNTCNLQCLMCHGELSSAIRSQREHLPPIHSPYDDAFFDELRQYLPHLREADFIGGEPFLARPTIRVWDLMLELGVQCASHVTTNGTIWNDRVARYLRELKMSVALSIDGVRAETVEALRVGVDFAELIENRDRLIAATRETRRAFTLNYCLMTENWSELADFLLEADALDVRVHVIPVLRPDHHSLFCLPDDEFAIVLGALQATDLAVRPHLGRNRAVWDSALAHLAGHRDRQLSRAVPVELRQRQISRYDAAADEAARQHVGDWSGVDPVRLDLAHGVVDSADLPDWAHAWAADLTRLNLPGRTATEVLDALASLFDGTDARVSAADPTAPGPPPPESPASPHPPESLERTFVIGDETVTARLRQVSWDEPGGRMGRAYLALNPLPGAVRGAQRERWLAATTRDFRALVADEPLRIDALDGLVETVEIPPWARALATPDWVGQPLAAVDEFHDRHGIAVDNGPEREVRPGVREVQGTLSSGSGGGPVDFLVHILSWEDGDGFHLRTLTAPRVPASAPAPG